MLREVPHIGAFQGKFYYGLQTAIIYFSPESSEFPIVCHRMTVTTYTYFLPTLCGNGHTIANNGKLGHRDLNIYYRVYVGVLNSIQVVLECIRYDNINA